MRQVKVNGKYSILMPDHRASREEWFKEPYWEYERIESMNKQLKRDDVLYYVGAELGEIPALCQMWGAKIYLFEPNHSAWPTIKAVWEANRLALPMGRYAGFVSNVHQPIPTNPDMALYKGSGWEVDSKSGWPGFALGDIKLDHGFSELHLEANGLPQFKIDSLVNEGQSPPTALAIDVEGSEFEVLKGAEETLRKYKPKIWMSWHPEFMVLHFETYLRNARDWLIGLGYKEQYLDYQHELHMYYS